MKRSATAPFLFGSILGLVVALALMAYFAAATSLTTVSATAVGDGTIAATAEFVVDATALWVLVLLLGAVGGFIVAVVAYAFGRAVDPDSPRYRLAYLLPVAIVLASAMAYSVVRLGVTMVGSTSSDTVTIAVGSMVIIVVIAGIVAGGATTPIVDALARPASIGDYNEATPASSKAFWMDLGGAIGVPTLAIVIVAFLAISLAQLLLTAHSTAVAVAVFSGVAALILGATTLLALRPWDRERA